MSSLKLLVSDKMFLIQWVGNITQFPFWAQAVELANSVHLHRLGEANVTDSSEDGAEGKKNYNKERWEFRGSPKLNKQLIWQKPCSCWLATLVPCRLMWHWKKYWDFSSARTVLAYSSPSAFGLECSGLSKEKLPTVVSFAAKSRTLQPWKCSSMFKSLCF